MQRRTAGPADRRRGGDSNGVGAPHGEPIPATGVYFSLTYGLDVYLSDEETGTNGSALPAESPCGCMGIEVFALWAAGTGLPAANPYVVDLEATIKNF